MAEVKFYKELSLPAQCEPNAWYLIASGQMVNAYVTDASGNPRLIGDDSVVIYRAGEDVNSHTPVAFLSGSVQKLDNTNDAHHFGFAGFTKHSAKQGENVIVQTSGVISLAGWGLNEGVHYLAAEEGTMQTNDAVSGGFRKVIGYASTSNDLLIIHSQSILKI